MDNENEKPSLPKITNVSHKRHTSLVCTNLKKSLDAELYENKAKFAFENSTNYFNFDNNKLIIGKSPKGPKYKDNIIVPHSVIGSTSIFSKNTDSISNHQTKNKKINNLSFMLHALKGEKITINNDESKKDISEKRSKSQNITFIDDLNLTKIFHEFKQMEKSNKPNGFMNNIPKEIQRILLMQEHNLDKSIEVEDWRKRMKTKIKEHKDDKHKILLTDYDKEVLNIPLKDKTHVGLDNKYGKNAWYASLRRSSYTKGERDTLLNFGSDNNPQWIIFKDKYIVKKKPVIDIFEGITKKENDNVINGYLPGSLQITVTETTGNQGKREKRDSIVTGGYNNFVKPNKKKSSSVALNKDFLKHVDIKIISPTPKQKDEKIELKGFGHIPQKQAKNSTTNSLLKYNSVNVGGTNTDAPTAYLKTEIPLETNKSMTTSFKATERNDPISPNLTTNFQFPKIALKEKSRFKTNEINLEKMKAQNLKEELNTSKFNFNQSSFPLDAKDNTFMSAKDLKEITSYYHTDSNKDDNTNYFEMSNSTLKLVGKNLLKFEENHSKLLAGRKIFYKPLQNVKYSPDEVIEVIEENYDKGNNFHHIKPTKIT